MGRRNWSLETQLIHAGEPKPRIHGSAVVPIFQGNVYEVTKEMAYGDIPYPRLSNMPNHLVLHEKLAAISGAEGALVTSSGMSAISTVMLALLQSGDHVLAQSTLYGGTHGLAQKHLPELGIETTLVELDAPDTWSKAIRPQTRLFYVETLTNPLIQMGDLEAVIEFCQANDLIAMIDNTFASPVNFQPAALGFDVEIHSASKYLNGHSDLIAGAVMGRAIYMKAIKDTLDYFGGSLDPHACFMLHRGLRTLSLRVKAQNANALKLAQFLETHPQVTQVHYPGLESSPSFERAKRLMRGFGGVLSFELKGGRPAADQFAAQLTLFVNGPSLGGVESLVTCPSSTSHAGMTPSEREAAGISEGLVRIAVGIESAEDLIPDLEQALDSL